MSELEARDPGGMKTRHWSGVLPAKTSAPGPRRGDCGGGCPTGRWATSAAAAAHSRIRRHRLAGARCAPPSADGSRTGSTCRRPQPAGWRCTDAPSPGCASAAWLGICCVPACSLASAEASHSGWPRHLRAHAVGLVLAAAADRHLHQRWRPSAPGSSWRWPTIGVHHRPAVLESRPPPIRPPKLASMPMAPDRVAAMVMIERVAMADMAQLVRHHARDLLAAQVAQQAGGRGHGGMLGIAAGREGVRLVLVDQVDARHRQAGALGEVAGRCRRARARRSARPPARCSCAAPSCRCSSRRTGSCPAPRRAPGRGRIWPPSR